MQVALAAKINFHPMLPKQTAILGLKFTLRQSLLVCSDRKRRKKNQNFKIINSSKQLRNYRNCKKWIKGQRHPIISINV